MGSAADPVDLLCKLMEGGAESVHGASLRDRHGDAVDELVRIGVLTPSDRPSVVPCRACDEDHATELQFDAATRRYFHFCPEAGRIEVEDADIEMLAVAFRWLIDWLVVELGVVPPARPRELVQDRAWHLGETIVGGTSVEAVFVRRISGFGEFDAIAASLRRLRKDTVGLLITTRRDLPTHVLLPHGYVHLDLREIARTGTDGLSLNRSRLDAWIKGIQRGARRPVKDGPGRSSEREAIEQIARERRDQHLVLRVKAAEARAVRNEFIRRYPNKQAPAEATIETHLRNMRP